MEYNRTIDIILLLAPVVILWVLTLLAYVKMRRRYMKAMAKNMEICSKQIDSAGKDNIGSVTIDKPEDDMMIDYKRLRANDERIVQFMDMFRLKDFG